MGLNKKIVGKEAIEELKSHPAIIEYYIRQDVLMFEDDEVQTEFEKLKDEFLKANPNL
jgi:hypothetical protein